MKKIVKFIKINKKNIILSFFASFAVGWLMGLNRPYTAFGGEDLLPLMVLLFWIIKYSENNEKN